MHCKRSTSAPVPGTAFVRASQPARFVRDNVTENAWHSASDRSMSPKKQVVHRVNQTNGRAALLILLRCLLLVYPPLRVFLWWHPVHLPTRLSSAKNEFTSPSCCAIQRCAAITWTATVLALFPQPKQSGNLCNTLALTALHLACE
jgi:hypothetical protein